MGFLESWQIAIMKPGAGADYRGFFGTIGVSDIVVKGVGLLFAVAMVGFLAVMYGFYRGQQWWRPVGTAMSVLSLVIFSLWWETIPLGNLAGTFAFNTVFLLVAYLWPHAIITRTSTRSNVNEDSLEVQ